MDGDVVVGLEVISQMLRPEGFIAIISIFPCGRKILKNANCKNELSFQIAVPV